MMRQLFFVLFLVLSPNFTSARVPHPHRERQIVSIHKEIQSFDEEVYPDPNGVIDTFLFQRVAGNPFLDFLLTVTNVDLSGVINFIRPDVQNQVALNNKGLILENCMKLYGLFDKLQFSSFVATTVLGFVVPLGEVSLAIDSAGKYSSLVQDNAVSGGRVVAEASADAGAIGGNILWSVGTLFIGPAIGLAVGTIGGAVTSLIQGDEGQEARSCSACYLSSILAHILLKTTHQDNSATADRYIFKGDSSRTNLKLCHLDERDELFDKKGFSEKRYLKASTYFYYGLDSFFAVNQAICNIASVGKAPGSAIKSAVESQVFESDFQSAAHIVGVQAVKFLANAFWKPLHEKKPTDLPIFDEWKSDIHF